MAPKKGLGRWKPTKKTRSEGSRERHREEGAARWLFVVAKATTYRAELVAGAFSARVVVGRHVSEGRCSTKQGRLSGCSCRGVLGGSEERMKSRRDAGVTNFSSGTKAGAAAALRTSESAYGALLRVALLAEAWPSLGSLGAATRGKTFCCSSGGWPWRCFAWSR